MKYAIGVDIGGTNTRVALIDEDFNLAKRVQFATDPKDPEGTLQKVARRRNWSLQTWKTGQSN